MLILKPSPSDTVEEAPVAVYIRIHRYTLLSLCAHIYIYTYIYMCVYIYKYTTYVPGIYCAGDSALRVPSAQRHVLILAKTSAEAPAFRDAAIMEA